MKLKINAIIAATILAMMGSAYGITCYLEQIVNCVKTGDTLGTFVMSSGTCAGDTVKMFADDYAWRFDIYSVTRGGLSGTATYTSLCDGFVNHGYPPGYGSRLGSGFNVYYSGSCTSSTLSTTNPDPNGTRYYQVTTSYLPSTPTLCN